jgi:KUP system potassium uptake protein
VARCTLTFEIKGGTGRFQNASGGVLTYTEMAAPVVLDASGTPVLTTETGEITGTISVNFLFILIGIAELGFSETLILGCSAILVQCLLTRHRWPRVEHVLFNVSSSAVAIAVAYFVYHGPLHTRLHPNSAFLLMLSAAVYFLLNTLPVATIIASQAVISAAFSVTQQAIQLGFLPRLNIFHTASHERGQIYVPLVNWTLAVATLGAGVGFGSSEHLAGAYGVAVSLLMAITTFLAALVAIQWGYNVILVVAVNGLFLIIDLIFFTANSIKLFEGGWFPLLLAVTIAFLMLTWRRGQRLSEKARSAHRESEKEFIAALLARPPARLPGTAAFLSSGTIGIPLPLTHHLKHLYALPERVLLVTILTSEEPRVREEERTEIHELAAGLCRVILHSGFMESPSVPEGLRLACDKAQLSCGDLEKVSYYIGRETIIPTKDIPGMWVWRETLYAFMQRNAERSAAYFCIPVAQVVEMGIELEI